MRTKSLFYVFVLFVSVLSFAFAAKPKELKIGMKAPNFKLEDAYGKSYTLSSYKGKMPVIVYFYPKAGTAGCTKEACGIRDDWGKFQKEKIQVLGISVDTKPEIKKFIKDNNLNFPLLSDASTKVSKSYGVYGKGGYDNRVTFIVDKNGIIRKIINVTNIEKHAKEVYDFAAKLR